VPTTKKEASENAFLSVARNKLPNIPGFGVHTLGRPRSLRFGKDRLMEIENELSVSEKPVDRVGIATTRVNRQAEATSSLEKLYANR